MQRLRRPGIHCLGVLLTINVAFGDDPNAARSNRFRLTIDSDVDLVVENEKQSILADTEIEYGWSHNGSTRSLTLHSVNVKSVQNGQVMQEFTHSRQQVTERVDGRMLKTTLEEAEDETRQLMLDAYESPICELTVDSQGRTEKQKKLAGPGAQTLLEAGLIENALLFHPPYHSDEHDWTHNCRFSMGFGGFVTGDLKYKRRESEDQKPTIDVDGVLLFEGEHKLAIPAKITRARYVVSGTQVYDDEVGEWVEGDWTIAASIAMVIQDTVPATGKGTMKLIHRRIQAPIAAP